VLLHGWGGNHESMLCVARRLKGARCIIPDLIGFGDSPHPDYALRVDDYVEAVINMLDKERISRACFICHSFGARIGIKLSAEYPERVSGLILTGAAGVRPRRKPIYYIKVFSYKVKKRFGIPTNNAGSPDYQALSDSMKGTFVNVVNEDLTPYLNRIEADTLIVHGERDTETPMYMAKIMNERIPSSSLIVLKGVGHFAYIDRLAEFSAIVNSYISAI